MKNLTAFLKENHYQVATAESCTSGLCAHILSHTPGASKFLKGGLIAYQEEVKVDLLEISPELIREKTVYSHEVAKAMAQKVREKFEGDIGLSTTGLAGPSGGTTENPVGTLYIGVDFLGEVRSYKVKLEGSREELQVKFAKEALLFLSNCSLRMEG